MDEDDLDSFFDDDDFAVKIQYTLPQDHHTSSKTREFSGIYSRTYIEKFGVSGLAHIIECPRANVSDIVEDVQITVDGKNFLVKEWEPDESNQTLTILLQEK